MPRLSGVAAFALTACADGTGTGDAGRLVVTPPEATCVSGDRVALAASLDGARADAAEFTVAGEGIWLPAVGRRGTATVTCEGVGRGVVSVSAAGQTALVPFVVRPPAPGLVHVAVAPAALVLLNGTRATLDAVVTSSLPDASTAPRFESSDTVIAAVDSLFGVVRARGPCSATITVRAHADPAARAVVPVTVTRGSIAVGGIAANPAAIDLVVGDSARITVDVFLASTAPPGTTRAATFTSRDPSVVRVSSAGVVRGVYPGRAIVEVSPVAAPALVTTVSVTVRDPAP